MMRNKRILGGALLLSMSLLGGGLNMGFSNNGQPVRRYCAACAGDLTDPGAMGAAGTSAVSVRLYDLPPDVRPLSAGDRGHFSL